MGVLPRLILGSASPRRLELLAQIGIRPDAVRPSDIDETPDPSENPRAYCRRMAREKAAALVASPGEVVLCADTTVALGRRILGKPADRAEAGRFLAMLSGRRHQVITAIALRSDETLKVRDVASRVRMRPLGEREISGYLDTGDWRGKAGGYGIQGPAAAFIPWISGSHSAIVGLPLSETAQMLMAAGYRPDRMAP